MKILRSGFLLFLLLSILTGIVYPLLVTGLGELFFPKKIAGSFIVHDGKTIGSMLIGQKFTDPRYFWGRPDTYDPLASGGSNLGPLNPILIDRVKIRVTLLQQYPVKAGRVPVDLVTASASGLDPHISPAGALYQADRIASVRGLSVEKVRELIHTHIEPRQFKIFGEPRVNVLQLNMSLDKI
jgi:K+-transporting ATPase ATPase C chain